MRALTLIMCFTLSLQIAAQDTVALTQSKLVTRVLAEELFIPWDMSWGPDGWIWFNERDGDIFRLHPDSKGLRHVFRIDDVYQSDDNGGFHAMALHPQFPFEPYVYTHYTVAQFESQLVRWTYDVGNDSLKEPWVMIDRIGANASHNGSRIVFDANENLLLAMGDAFSNDVAQDVDNMNGKVLRIKLDGSIPKSNPFPDSYTWSYGHRNPQGLVYGRDSVLYSSEHGEATDDEINVIYKGKNYGWPQVEGFCDQQSEMQKCESLQVEEPISIWTPTYAPCGLAYFDHPSIPEWRHCLLQGFLKERRLTIIPLSEDGLAADNDARYDVLIRKYGRIRDVLVSPNGRLFVCTSNNEANGATVPPDNYDKIIEIFNPDFEYESFVPEVIDSKPAEVLFPNPTSTGFAWFKTPGITTSLELFIYDQQGNMIRNQSLQESFAGIWQVDLRDINPGVYTIRYSSEEDENYVRVVITQ